MLAVLSQALLVALPWAASSTLPAVQVAQRAPLEDLLERARAEREQQRALLTPLISAALDSFSARGDPPTEARREALVDQLAAFGLEAGPFLLPHLEPAGEDPVARARALAVAEALARLQGPALTDPLVALLSQGSEMGRRNALRALETSPEPERVRPVLRQVFDAAPTGALKQAALRTLIRLGGPQNARLYAEILSQDDAELVELALNALLDTRDAQAAPQVRQLLADTARAQRHAELLLAYYSALPQLVDAQLLQQWVAVVEKGGSLDLRVAVVDALPAIAGSAGADLRRALEPLAYNSEPKLRESVLVAMARLGDRNARRDLLASYDEIVERNDRFPEAYLRRAQVYLRIEEWDDAIKDFQQALRLSRDDSRPQPEAYIGLARAHARRGRLRDAAEWLRKAPISIKELRELADDPDFAELRASRYSKDAFGL